MPFKHEMSDRLVSIRKDGTRVGKRIPKDCLISREAIRLYVETGSSIKTVKQIRFEQNCSLREATDRFILARGKVLSSSTETLAEVQARFDRGYSI